MEADFIEKRDLGDLLTVKGPLLRGKDRFLDTGKYLGEGTYGKVTVGIDLTSCKDSKQPESKDLVAIKRCVMLPKSERVGFSGVHFSTWREIRIMREVTHPNLMTFRDVFVDGEFVCVIMDLLNMDLQKYLSQRPHLSENKVKCILHQLLQGLAALHELQFMHRDLSPANVFISPEGVCKVADFGFARQIASPHRDMTQQIVTCWYRPPEIGFGAQQYGTSVDIWSVGCIFAQMLRGEPLFRVPDDNVKLLSEIFDMLGTPTKEDWPDVELLPFYCEFTVSKPKPFRHYFPTANEDAIDILQHMLQLNPAKRKTAKELLNHAYFSPTSHPQMAKPNELFFD